MSVGRQVSETCGVTSYGSGWRKDVVNRCLEFAVEHWVFLLLGLTSTETTYSLSEMGLRSVSLLGLTSTETTYGL